MSVAYCTELPAAHHSRGGDPQYAALELLAVVKQAIRDHPRSNQTMIGPSELGHPCSRRIGYKLLNIPQRDTEPAWKPAVGTAVHAHLETMVQGHNVSVASLLDGQERYYTETKVSVGEINGVEVAGSCDIYDRVTATVWDWKTVGPTQLQKYARNGPGDQYRIQAHLYGRGWQRAGLPVDHVGVIFLPRNGELDDTHIWAEPYSEDLAAAALERAAGIDLTVKTLGASGLAALPTADAWCNYCPFFQAKSQDLTGGCPGDPESNVNKSPQSAFDGIV